MTREEVERICKEARQKGEWPDLTGARLTGANLKGADLTGARLTYAKLTGANLYHANLAGANLTRAHLTRACLTDANLEGANLIDADLSGAKGLLDPWQWLVGNFEQTKDGFIVYKRCQSGDGKTEFSAPEDWIFEPGAFLRETPNPCRTVLCGSGVNYGTRKWCDKNYTDADLWECLLTWEGVASNVVPYNTDGKARTGVLQLLRKL